MPIRYRCMHSASFPFHRSRTRAWHIENCDGMSPGEPLEASLAQNGIRRIGARSVSAFLIEPSVRALLTFCGEFGIGLTVLKSTRISLSMPALAGPAKRLPWHLP
jgi:hypothetical protein